MSEANHVWRVEFDGHEYEIELDHLTLTGKATVTVDGKEVGESRMLARKKTIAFDLGGHPGRVELEFAYGGIGARSSLHVDDRYVEPLAA